MNTQALQELRKMKQLMEKGFISKEEYEKKRLEFINNQTNTTYEKKEPKKEEISLEEVQEPIKEENDPNVEISTWNGRKWVQPKMDPELEKQIFKAVLGRSVDLLKSLHESGANFNIRDKYGNTPLHYACEIGIRPVIQFLVERGARINVANQDRKTPLHILVEKKWADVAKWLLFQGADPNMKDKDLKTPIYYANPWLAGEMKEILLQRERSKAVAQSTVVVTSTNDYGLQPTILNIKSGSGDTSVEIVKESAITRDKESNEDRPEEFPVQLTNGNAKIITIYTTYNAQKLVSVACKAFGMEEIEQNLRIAVRKGTKDDKGVLHPDEYIGPNENIDRLRYNDWPTPTSYKLVMLPVQGASQSISMRYRELMYGEKKTDWSNVEIKAPPKKPVDKYLFPKKEKKDDGNDKKKQKEEMKEFKKKQEEKKKEEKKKK